MPFRSHVAALVLCFACMQVEIVPDTFFGNWHPK